MSTTGPGRTRPTVKQFTPPAEQDYGASDGAGWVLFAGVMLALLATLNLIDGIAAVSNSTFFVGDAKFILSDLNTWGWVLIVMSLVQGASAVGVWLQLTAVRWIGVAIAALNAIVQMLFIS